MRNPDPVSDEPIRFDAEPNHGLCDIGRDAGKDRARHQRTHRIFVIGNQYA